jgi:hypothetical protein
MLWSRNHDFICIAVTDGKHPGSPALAEDSPCQPVEAAVWHPLLDRRITDNVHPVADLKFLDNGSYGGKPALS